MNKKETVTEDFGASLGSSDFSMGCLGFRKHCRTMGTASHVFCFALENTFVLASILRNSACRRRSRFQNALKMLRLV